MAETPEPLAAILAEMRADVADGENAFFIRADWLALCDRIEAAAERERDEDRQLAAIAESDEAFARCARCDRPERAPGNPATAEALARIHNGGPKGAEKNATLPYLAKFVGVAKEGLR